MTHVQAGAPRYLVSGPELEVSESAAGGETGQQTTQAECLAIDAVIALTKPVVARLRPKLPVQLDQLDLDGQELTLTIEHALDVLWHRRPSVRQLPHVANPSHT